MHRDPVCEERAVGNVRPDHDEVSRGYQPRVAGRHLAQIAVEFGAAVRRMRQIAMRAVPRNIALEEGDGVTALLQSFAQGPVGGGVAVSPR